LDYSELQNKTKDKIIESAFNLFSSKGIHNVSIVQIANDSEVGVASIYRYFGTKKTIINNCANYVWKKMATILENTTSSKEFINLSGIDKIEKLLNLFVMLYTEKTDYLKYISEYDAYLAQEELSAEEKTLYNKNFLLFRIIAEMFYNEGINDETIRDDIDFETFYYSITRALLDVSMKGANSPILIETDNVVSIDKQLKQLISMAIFYCKKGD
jgi:AcrR family transcriptional regulator